MRYLGWVILLSVMVCGRVFSQPEIGNSKEPPLTGEGEIRGMIQQWSGQDSQMMQLKYIRIMSPGEWEKIWKEHSDSPVPEIDFEKNMVLSFFVGQVANVSGVKAVDIAEIDDHIRFRFALTGFQTSGHAVLTVPYGLFVLPKSDKIIKLEKDVNHLIGQSPIWKPKGELSIEAPLMEGPKRQIVTEEEFREKGKRRWETLLNGI